MTRLNYCMLAFMISILAFDTQNLSASQQLASHVEVRNGITLVTIENEYISLTFDPSRGGRCTHFILKKTGEDIVGNGEGKGLFIDHWAQYTWPSGLMYLPYQYELTGDGKNEIGIRLWVKVPKMGGGKGAVTRKASLETPTSPDLIGLTVSKTVTLNRDSDAVYVKQEITNTTAESRTVGMYVQNALSFGGSIYGNTWYLPSTQGVEYRLQPDDSTGRSKGADWILEPTGGWLAVRNRVSGRGLLFAFDYNYLRKIYTCGSTAEWFMEPVPVMPGKTFRSDYIIKPTDGFNDFVYGSKNIVADIQADEVKSGIKVRLDLSGVSHEIKNVNVNIKIRSWKSKSVITEKTCHIDSLGYKKQEYPFAFPVEKVNAGIVIHVAVVADGVSEQFEYYYAGEEEEYNRRHNDFALKGKALAGTRGDTYFRQPPKRKKTYDKPDLKKIAGPAQDRFKTLVIFGLYTNILNLDDALESWRYNKKIRPQFAWANCPPNAVEGFPGNYEELFAYNTVVLSDVNYKALGDTAFEMLCDYVEMGGNLLVIGGPYALGNGEFDDTRFQDVLPVKLKGAFDLKWAGKGKAWNLEPVDAGQALLRGVSFEQKPKVFWQHSVEAKPNTEVVLKAGNMPTLILGTYGKGKVAVFTLSPTGKAENGETAWWNWQGWYPLVQNVFTWLNSR